MGQEETALQAANDRLLAIRREQGITETGRPSRTISTEDRTGVERLFMPDSSKCWKHRDQEKPCPICAEEWRRREQEEAEKLKVQQERERQEEERQRLEEEKRRQDLFDHPEKAMEESGVSPRFLECSFEAFRGGDRYLSVCRECAENPQNLVLYGTTGSGKTHLAVSIIREIVRRGGKARFVSVPRLLLEIRSTFNRGGTYFGDTEAEIIERCAEEPLLVLDDLGSEKGSEWSISTLFLIIDQRYQSLKPTIVTTNLSPDLMEKELGARIASRLASMRVGEIRMPDYRKVRSTERGGA